MTAPTITGLRVGVLGPLIVERGERMLELGGPKQRAVLAMLLTSPDRAVPRDRILQGVWGEEASEANRGSFHTYLSNLRAQLGEVIIREGDGYRLDLPQEHLDSVVFEQAVEDARGLIATDPGLAADRLWEALAMWRGLPYGDLLDVQGLQTEVRRLQELRLTAVELRIEADLAAGRHDRIIAEVEALAEEHPTRERFRAQHMLALYRSGRQAEALRAYRRTEAWLAEELGLEPSKELQELELGILQQDDQLRAGPGRVTTQRLAFLVTDIEASTGAWERDPGGMAEALATHDRILRETIERWGGRVFKHTGDGALTAFPDVVSAVAAAEAAQRAFAASDWGEVGKLRVRMGIDVGEAEARGGDFYGPPLNRAARLCAGGHGGQVLVSAAAQAEIAAAAPAGVQIRQLGEHRLRGLAAPERVAQVVFVGLPADFPELRVDADSALDERQPAPALPGYELRELIGEGAFGVVYRAYQPSVGREVAIKIIRPELASHPSFVRRFEAEGRTIARLAHPHIVPLIDFWRDPEGAYLVLQLLPGGSLRDVLSGGVDRGTARRILLHVGEALDHAHAQGVVHGDLQPANVLLDGAGNTYLSDFGIAARLIAPQVVASVSSAPAFRAPEERSAGPSQAADRFAFGMLARQLLGDEPDLEEVLARATAAHPGDRYPSAAALLTGLDEALGEEPAEVERPMVSRNPYKGLRAFEESDAADFYGRDELVATLVAAVERHRFVTVVGPSGSGKSSAVQAGLLPALAVGGVAGSEQWFRAVLTPGLQPLESLFEALEAVAPEPVDLLGLLEGGDLAGAADRLLAETDGELLLVVDQFEELFTLVDSPQRRQAFIDLLVDAVERDRTRVRVVATLRADFYDRPLAHDHLDRLVRDGLVTVLRPTREEWVEIISRPAQAVGLRWEPGLPHRIAQDVVDQPGGLPLLQYALTELVELRRTDLLAEDDYRRIGGVGGALATRAEGVFGELSPFQQEAARQVLLRLVTVDEDTDATRRRVRRSELESLGIDRADLQAVLGAFTAERLLIADRDPVTRGPTLEVAHEALLREWPRLRSWIEDQREALILGRRLRAAMAEWEAAEWDEDYLLTGSRLAPFLGWAESSALSADERAFLAASEEKDETERAARARRRRVLTGVLASATFVATLLASVALVQRERAETEAARAEREAESARQAEQLATARELAASAINVLQEDPELSILLALEAAQIADPPPEAVRALHRAVQSSRTIFSAPLDENSPPVFSHGVAISPDGRRLAVTGTGRYVDIWDIDAGPDQTAVRFGELRTDEPSQFGPGAAFSPDGTIVASHDHDGILHLWNIADGTERRIETPGVGPGHPIVFSADGRRLATRVIDRRPDPRATHVVVWDVASGAEVARWDVEHPATVSIGFDPAGNRLAVADFSQARAVVFDIETGDELAVAQDDVQIMGVAFSPDGLLLATTGFDGAADLWDASTGEHLADFIGHEGVAYDVAFAPDGRRLVTASEDGTVRLWDVATRTSVMVLSGHRGPAFDLSLSADGTRIASGSGDRTTRVWDVTPARAGEVTGYDLGRPMFSKAPMARHGSRVALVGREPCAFCAGPLVVVDLDTGQRIEIPGQGGLDVVFTADGSTVISQAAVTGEGGRFELGYWPVRGYDVESGEVVFELDGRACGTATLDEFCDENPDWPLYGQIVGLALDPVGQRVIVAGDNATQSMWRMADGRLLWVESELPGGGPSAMHPDGTFLVTTDFDGVSVLTFPDLKEVARIPLVHPMKPRFSSDGSLLAVGSFSNEPIVVDTRTWEVRRRLRVDGASDTAVTEDEKSVVTLHREGSVRLWDVETGEELQRVPVEAKMSEAGLVLLDDERQVLVMSEQGALLVMTLDNQELIDIARSRVTRSLTDEECQTYLHGPCT